MSHFFVSAAESEAAKLIDVLVMKKALDPYYAEYLFTNKTRILDIAKPTFDCVEDDSALLQVASIESPVNSYEDSFSRLIKLEELKNNSCIWVREIYLY